eukprot:5180159-Prymnesium_polylepis.2
MNHSANGTHARAGSNSVRRHDLNKVEIQQAEPAEQRCVRLGDAQFDHDSFKERAKSEQVAREELGYSTSIQPPQSICDADLLLFRCLGKLKILAPLLEPVEGKGSAAQHDHRDQYSERDHRVDGCGRARLTPPTIPVVVVVTNLAEDPAMSVST